MRNIFTLCLAAVLVSCALEEPEPAIEGVAVKSVGTVVSAGSSLDSIVFPSATMEKLADGFTLTEGPI